jgi:hypothetical protein
MPTAPPRPPKVCYENRLADLRRQQQILQKQDSWLAAFRLICFGTGLLFLLGGLVGRHIALLALLPTAAFVFAVLRHDTVFLALGEVRRRCHFYEAALERLRGKLPADAALGPQLADASQHPYATDLDLFGTDGIFGFLCTAKTASGQRTLAQWLLHSPLPGSLGSMQRRQKQVQALVQAQELREDLASLGAQMQHTVHDDLLARWAEAPMDLPTASWQRQFWICHLLFATAALLGFVSGYWFGILLAGGWQWQVARRFAQAQGSQSIAAGLEEPRRELPCLAQIMARLQKASLDDADLANALGMLRESSGIPAHRAIGRLEGLGRALDARKNQLFAPFAWLLLWEPHLCLRILAWRAAFGPRVRRWLDAVGEVEALLSLGGYAFEHPEDIFAELVSGERDPAGGAETPVFSGLQLRHPLLPAGTAVANDVQLDAAQRLLIVSGSNMSGKSTLLRTVGLQAVLSFCGAPVPADRLRLSPLQVGATLRVQDSLQAGRSRFFAELSRLRQLKEASAGPVPLLFLLDEILHGTNSHDRAVGAEALLQSLLGSGAIGLVTTHDLSLSRCAPTLHARNVHFADDWIDAALRFDYKMRDGVVQKSNALALMQQAGLL